MPENRERKQLKTNLQPILYSLAVVAFLSIIAVLVLAKIIEKEHLSEQDLTTIARQAVRWYIASIQDKNPVVRGLHADYAVAYGDILKQLEHPDVVLQTTGLDVDKFLAAATQVQDDYMQEVITKCPHLLSSADRKKLASFLHEYKFNTANNS